MSSNSGYFLEANKTGAVAKPNFKSAAAGLPSISELETKSNKSSTSWNAIPTFLPYSYAALALSWISLGSVKYNEAKRPLALQLEKNSKNDFKIIKTLDFVGIS